MGEHITMAFDTYHTRRILRRDGWKVNPKTFWQKLAWRLLNKHGAVTPYHEDVEVCKVVEINGDDILGAVMEARACLFQINRRPSRILIGRADLMEIMKNDKYRHINTYVNISGSAGYGDEMFGIPMTIIPHMRGVLVL